jgi:short-subunit dehydrogenase
MKDLRGRTALVTGASGGIGKEISRALAREGMNVVVSGRRRDVLDALVTELHAAGAQATAVEAELGDLDQAQALVERSEAALGPLDVLVHNAGIEIAASFTDYSPQELAEMISINLAAPLLMTRRALPGMLDRGRGHVVFISSVAGKFGTGYQAPYGASKAGLVALTQALRDEYRRAPVGFSVVCPGFVAGDGMYQRMLEDGFKSNRLMGWTNTNKVALQVVRAIRDDVPEVVVSGSPVRPVLALAQLSPRIGAAIVTASGASRLFRRVAQSRDRQR